MRPVLVAVVPALLVAADEEGRHPVLLPAGPSLADRLVATAATAERDVHVVTTPPHAEAVRRAVRFCRLALRTDRVVAEVVGASPFRAAVMIELQRQAEAAGLVPSGAGTTLHLLEELTAGFVATDRALRLRSPRPRSLQRLSSPLGRRVLVGPDGPDGTHLHLLRPDGTGALEMSSPARLPARQAVSLWVAPAPRPVALDAWLQHFSPVDVVTVEPDRLWWQHRGAPVTEVVVAPHDVGALAPLLAARESVPWRCYWCRATSSAPAVCARCGADGRDGTGRQGRDLHDAGRSAAGGGSG